MSKVIQILRDWDACYRAQFFLGKVQVAMRRDDHQWFLCGVGSGTAEASHQPRAIDEVEEPVPPVARGPPGVWDDHTAVGTVHQPVTHKEGNLTWASHRFNVKKWFCRKAKAAFLNIQKMCLGWNPKKIGRHPKTINQHEIR